MKTYKRKLGINSLQKLLVTEGNLFHHIENISLTEHITYVPRPEEFQVGKKVPAGFFAKYGFEKQHFDLESEALRDWLNHPDRKGVVSISELEKRIGCPRSTLGQWLTGKRPLPQKWEKPLLKQLKKLDFSNGLTGYASERNP